MLDLVYTTGASRFSSRFNRAQYNLAPQSPPDMVHPPPRIDRGAPFFTPHPKIKTPQSKDLPNGTLVLLLRLVLIYCRLVQRIRP